MWQVTELIVARHSRMYMESLYNLVMKRKTLTKKKPTAAEIHAASMVLGALARAKHMQIPKAQRTEMARKAVAERWRRYREAQKRGQS